MRNLSFYILMVFAPLATIAQTKDPWIGDWTSESYSDIDWDASNATKDANGTIQEVIYADYRLVIRISKNADQYYVRAKTLKTNDPSYVDYGLSLTVTSVDDNTMYLESFASKIPFRVNGEIDEYSDITYYYKLILEDEVIHYHYYRCHSVDYDKKLRYKGQEDIPTSYYKDSKLDLFNDNW